MSIVPRNDSSYKQLLDSAIKNVLQSRTLEQTVKEYLTQVKEPGGGEKPHLRIAFAEAFKQAGNIRQMLEHLRVAADLLPRDLDLRRQVIDGYRELGDMNSALAAYQDWARLDPQNIEIYRGMGDLYDRMGRRPDALLAWATMAEVRPREAEGYRAYGQKLLAVNQPDRAAVALRQAVKYRPTEFNIASELASAYTALKQQDKIPPLWTDGEAACRKAIEDLADDPAPWLNLGSFLAAQGRKSDARNIYVQILQRTWPRFQNETYIDAKKRLAD
jgi:tetratricopeptide (TPR) repeat protein